LGLGVVVIVNLGGTSPVELISIKNAVKCPDISKVLPTVFATASDAVGKLVGVPD
jgi:hypothetical protein